MLTLKNIFFKSLNWRLFKCFVNNHTQITDRQSRALFSVVVSPEAFFIISNNECRVFFFLFLRYIWHKLKKTGLAWRKFSEIFFLYRCTISVWSDSCLAYCFCAVLAIFICALSPGCAPARTVGELRSEPSLGIVLDSWCNSILGSFDLCTWRISTG